MQFFQYVLKVSEMKTQALILLCFEIILSIVVAFEFLKVFGFAFDLNSKEIVLSSNLSIFDAIIFLTGIALLFAINLRLKKRFPEIHAIQGAFFQTLNNGIKEKFHDTKSNPRILAHLLVEISFAAVIALVSFALLEENVEIIHWEKLGISEPLITIFNAVILLIILAGLVYLFNFTKSYRIERIEKKKLN